MTWKVDERKPEDLFIKLMIKKANGHQRSSQKEYGSVNHSCQYWTNYGDFQNL